MSKKNYLVCSQNLYFEYQIRIMTQTHTHTQTLFSNPAKQKYLCYQGENVKL